MPTPDWYLAHILMELFNFFSFQTSSHFHFYRLIFDESKGAQTDNLPSVSENRQMYLVRSEAERFRIREFFHGKLFEQNFWRNGSLAVKRKRKTNFQGISLAIGKDSVSQTNLVLEDEILILF